MHHADREFWVNIVKERKGQNFETTNNKELKLRLLLIQPEKSGTPSFAETSRNPIRVSGEKMEVYSFVYDQDNQNAGA